MLKKTGLNPHSLWLNYVFEIPALITDCFSVCGLSIYNLKKYFQQNWILSLSFFILQNTFFHLLVLSAFCPPICPLNTGEKEDKQKKIVRHNLKQQKCFFLRQNLNKTSCIKIQVLIPNIQVSIWKTKTKKSNQPSFKLLTLTLHWTETAISVLQKY